MLFLILSPYLILINAAGFLFMLADKQKARRGSWRISEATLLSIAVAGGSLGCYIGMRVFHHKTRNPKFSVGLPVLLAIHIVLSLILIIL